MTAQDLLGRRFGRLVVRARAANAPAGGAQWLCICDCGHEKTIPARALVRNQSRSCGCLHSEIAAKTNTVHGFTRRGRRHPLYDVWRSMWTRCTSPKHRHFASYGGRGIAVCERWRSFEAFLSDLGQRPAGTTLDRIDNDGNYEPGNVRWATAHQQRANRRDSKGG